MKRLGYLLIGFTFLGLGFIGSIIPILPTVPFLLISTYCFVRSSNSVAKWFTNTKLYKNNLADFVSEKRMTIQAKLRIMISVTMLMIVGFIIMGLSGIYLGCAILFIIWIFHVLYFVFGIKTKSVI